MNSILRTIPCFILTNIAICSDQLNPNPAFTQNENQPFVSSRKSLCQFAMDKCSDVVKDLNKKNLEDCPVDIAYLNCLKTKEYARLCSGNSFYNSHVANIQRSIEDKCTKSKIQNIPPVLPPSPPDLKSKSQCRFNPTHDTTYKTCLIYGDPHVLDFSGHQQTCRLLGSWPMVDNRFFSVQISQRDVVEGAAASAVTKVTVIVRNEGECLKEKLPKPFYSFTAVSKYGLPLTFDDGSMTLAGGTIAVRMIDPNQPNAPQLKGDSKSFILQENRYKISKTMPQVREIILNHIDTKIVLRQIDNYISVALHSPDSVTQGIVNNVWELCRQGCPPQEQQPHRESFLSRQIRSDEFSSGISVNEAETECQKYPLVGAFFHNCVFDYIMTKNSKVAKIANLAQNDLYDLQGKHLDIRFISNKTRYKEYRPLWMPLNISHRNSNPMKHILLIILFLRYIFAL